MTWREEGTRESPRLRSRLYPELSVCTSASVICPCTHSSGPTRPAPAHPAQWPIHRPPLHQLPTKTSSVGPSPSVYPPTHSLSGTLHPQIHPPPSQGHLSLLKSCREPSTHLRPTPRYPLPFPCPPLPHSFIVTHLSIHPSVCVQLSPLLTSTHHLSISCLFTRISTLFIWIINHLSATIYSSTLQSHLPSIHHPKSTYSCLPFTSTNYPSIHIHSTPTIYSSPINHPFVLSFFADLPPFPPLLFIQLPSTVYCPSFHNLLFSVHPSNIHDHHSSPYPSTVTNSSLYPSAPTIHPVQLTPN